MHNKVISFSEIENFKSELSRKHFLNKKISKKINRKISAKYDLLFMPISIYDDVALQDEDYSPAVYKIIIFGILEDGSRASVVLNDIKPYIEIKVPSGSDPDNFSKEILCALSNVNKDRYEKITGKLTTDYFKLKVRDEVTFTKGKYFKIFQENQDTYARIYFYKAQDRKYAIEYLTKLYPSVIFTHNDLNNYYRVVCRDYLISFNSWCVLSQYEQTYDHSRIKGTVLSMSIDNYKIAEENPAAAILSADKLKKDPTLSMCWDIETYKKFDPTDKEPPMPDNLEHVMFMIGVTFQWYHSADQLLRICFVQLSEECANQIKPHEKYLTVACTNESDVIETFAKVWSWMLPDLILGFNDGMYDWPWLKLRGQHHNLLKQIAQPICQIMPSEYGGNPWTSQKITSRYFKATKYKLDADTEISSYKLHFPGYVAIDVRTIFRQLFPNDEASSLNHYLIRLGIKTKLDVNFKDMFDMYEEIQQLEKQKKKVPQNLMDLMQQVAHYCVVDSQRCHELMHKLYVVMDKRAISHMSYVSFQDAIERANGMKVRNLIIAAGQQAPFNLKFCNNSIPLQGEKSKYPGAYVFPPRKGLVCSKLSVVERIATQEKWSDLSNDMISNIYSTIDEYGACISEDELLNIENKNNPQFPEFVREFFNEQIQRPITGLDFNSLYPSLMITYNLSTEYMILDVDTAKELATRHTLFPVRFPFNGKPIRGWVVRHDNKINPAEDNFKLGIFGYVLKNLFDKRKSIKKEMHTYAGEIKKLEDSCADLVNSDEYANAIFQYEYLNSIQKALKTYMNTFYGEIGNPISPFFMVQIAGAITTNGSRCIQLAEQFLKNTECSIYYGDSIVADEPVILQDQNNKIIICVVSEIVGINDWFAYPQFKSDEDGRFHKQQALTEYKIWTDCGWKKIKRVIRHKTNKKIYRVATNSGCVDVTEDHSLLTENLKIIKPGKCQLGDNLLHSFPSAGELSDAVKCNYQSDAPVKFSSKLDAQIYYYAARKCGQDMQIDATENNYILHATNNNYTLHATNNNYILSATKPAFETGIQGPNSIKRIFELPSVTKNLFVYDIETECGRFNAGIGGIILKNTDSCYVSMPDKYFIDVDKKYFTNKITKQEYWNSLVEITLQVIVQIRDEINEYFHKDNGTRFLNMAFEEALFPVLFAAKKKYVGIAHEVEPSFSKPLDIEFIKNNLRNEIVNKFPEYNENEIQNEIDNGIIAKRKKQFFLRGLDIVRRGMPNFAKEIVLDILETMMNISNTKTVFDIVQDKIKNIYSCDWSSPDKFYKFIMTDQFKPHKKNEKLHVFVQRMAKERNVIIKPFERFKYIIARKYPYKYDICGRKQALKGGEKMELAEIAFENKIPIDIDCYMNSKLNGQLARLITYHPQFTDGIDEINMNAEDKLTQAEKIIYDNSVKWVETYSSNFNSKYVSTGDIYKKISSNVASLALMEINDATRLNVNKKLLIPKSMKEIEAAYDWVIAKAESEASKKTKKYAEKYIKTFIEEYVEANKMTKESLPKNKFGKPIHKTVKESAMYKLFEIYCGNFVGGSNTRSNLHMMAEATYKKKDNDLREQLYANIEKINLLMRRYNSIIEGTAHYVVEQNNITMLHVPNVNIKDVQEKLELVTQFLENNKFTISKKIISILNNQPGYSENDLHQDIMKYELIYNDMIYNNIYILEIRSVVAEIQKYKDKIIGFHNVAVENIDVDKMIDDICGEHA